MGWQASHGARPEPLALTNLGLYSDVQNIERIRMSVWPKDDAQMKPFKLS
jgi:hypothetical protein